MKKISVVLSILLCLVINSAATAQEKFDLNYKFEKGKTYFFSQKNLTDINMSMMGQEINMSTDSKMKMRFEIVERKDKNLEIITSIDSMLVKSTNPMQGGEQINNGEGIVGKRTKIIMDPAGKVISKIEIDSSALTKMNMSFSGTNENMMRLSSKPAAIGESWQNIDTLKMNIGPSAGVDIIQTTDMKIEGKEKYEGNDCLKISIIQKQVINGAIAAEGQGIGMEGSTVMKGYGYFDYKNGLMLNLELAGEGNITMNLTEQGMSMPMNQKSKTVVTLIK